MERGLLCLGATGGVFDSLEGSEWIMFTPYCADAGVPRAVTASFRGKRRLRVTDVTGRALGALKIKGRRIPIPADALEAGVTADPTDSLRIPDDAPGGIYFVDDQWAFVVSRPEASCTAVVPVSTMQAFNDWGGRSEYTERARQREAKHKIPLHHYSLRRPLARRFAVDVLSGFLDWLPRGALAGEEVRFVPDYDLERAGALVGTKLLLIPGRSEYWSRKSRQAIDAYADNGGDMVLLSSETMLHEIRHEEGRNAWWWYGSPEDPRKPATPYWNDRARRYPLLPSIGPNPAYGGSHKPEAKQYPAWGVYRAFDTNSPLAKACGLGPGDSVALPSMVYYDGLPVRRYANEVPVLDERVLTFHRWSLLGYSFGHNTPLRRIGAWFAFQRSPTSGRAVHFGSYGWSTMEGLGGKGPGGARPAEVVDAAIRLIRSGADLFAPQPAADPSPSWLRRLRSAGKRRLG